MTIFRVPAWLRIVCMSVLLLAGLAVAASAAQFKYDERANADLARKLKIPVYFAVPPSAYAELPADIKTSDKLLLFRHPDANGTEVGLRVVVTKRSGMAQRLGSSGLIQTGDLLLTLRAEWGGAGAYPNVQMGISHTGIAYIKGGTLYQLDNPMDEVYLGRGLKGDFTSEHYRTLNLLHVVRPRGLTEENRKNLLGWITRLNALAAKVYPSQIKFNQDYSAPKFRKNSKPEFVKHLGQIALGLNPPGTIDLYCSEFAWAVLSLRGCDPEKSETAFRSTSMPACIASPMEPLVATGNAVGSSSRHAYAGLADGPLMVIDALKLPVPERAALLKSVFVENPAGMDKMSVGHKAVAQQYQSDFSKLESYYLGMSGGSMLDRIKASYISSRFRQAILQNYSPTSYLINTLLPPDNVNRTMDYVATILIE